LKSNEFLLIGCYIYGLYFDGATWDTKNQCIGESEPRVLFTKIPHIWLVPTNVKPTWMDSNEVINKK
jgi:dynein heavy chain, axonemal